MEAQKLTFLWRSVFLGGPNLWVSHFSSSFRAETVPKGLMFLSLIGHSCTLMECVCGMRVYEMLLLCCLVTCAAVTEMGLGVPSGGWLLPGALRCQQPAIVELVALMRWASLIGPGIRGQLLAASRASHQGGCWRDDPAAHAAAAGVRQVCRA